MAQQGEDVLDEDELVVSDAGAWAEEKHRCLGAYVDATHAVRARWGDCAYIDLYSGPGRQYVESSARLINGSPVVAWAASTLHGVPFKQVFISDRDSYVRACEKRLTRLGAPVTIAALKAKDAAGVAAKRADPNGLHLVFADPYNLKDLPWEVVRPLFDQAHIDFIVHFSEMDLTRNLDRYITQDPSPLDAFAPGWRKHLTRAGRTTTRGQFFEYWVSLWAAEGFKLADQVPLMTSSSNSPLYRLVLFSRHPLAKKIWNSVAKSRTQGLLFG